MSRRALLPLLPLFALVGACATQVEGSDPTGNEGSRIRHVAQDIVNGTPSSAADNAIVYIAVNGNSGDFCTGTLIAPNLVITARHCVSTLDETIECGNFLKQSAPSTLSISVGTTPGASIATAIKIIVDTSKSVSSCSNDIAMFQLDKDVPGAMVAKVRLTPLAVGEVARTAGYGDSGSGTPTSSRYQRTGLKVDSVGPASYMYKTTTGQGLPVTVPVGEIVTGESTCFGDSGGPLFDAAGNIIGVTSRGIDEKCIDRPSIYSDTASHAKMITDAAAAAGHPLTDANPMPGSGTTPGGASPATNDPKTGDTSTADDSSGDDTTTETPATPAKKKRSSLAAPSAGCSAAPGPASSPSSSLALLALTLGAVLVRMRRTRSGLR